MTRSLAARGMTERHPARVNVSARAASADERHAGVRSFRLSGVTCVRDPGAGRGRVATVAMRLIELGECHGPESIA
jgi:hypothetical protein